MYKYLEEQRRNQETLVPPAPEKHINSDQQVRLNGDTEREPPQKPQRSKRKRISTFEKHLKEYTV